MSDDHPYEYDNAVYIGRFQPFHAAHLDTIRAALKIAHRVIVVIGSSHGAITLKNPFTYEERKDMIRLSLTPEEQERVRYMDITDNYESDDIWVASLQVGLYDDWGISVEDRNVLIGHQKDASSYYLKMTGLRFVDAGVKSNLNATDLRHLMWQGILPGVEEGMTEGSFKVVSAWVDRGHVYNALLEDHAAILAAKSAWKDAPYPPTFLTADAVVTYAGHVLLVTRGSAPGKGMWALPGGHVNPGETLRQCAVRELVEETNIPLLPQMLDMAITRQETFDYPDRDPRGRYVTTAYRFDLDRLRPAMPMPHVRAGDDAGKAKWVPIHTALSDPADFFADHYSILLSLTR